MPEEITGAQGAQGETPAISEDAIRNHPLYQELLSESIQRRQTIAALKAEMRVAQTPEPAPAEQPPSGELDELRNMVAALTQRIEQDQQTRIDRARRDAIARFNVPEELQEFVVGDSEDVITSRAERLRGPQPHQGTTPVGGGSQEPDEDLLNRVKARITGKDQPNVFAPGIHRTLGGGPV